MFRNAIAGLAWSPDDRYLAAADESGLVAVAQIQLG
jgi:hypothetical protein